MNKTEHKTEYPNLNTVIMFPLAGKARITTTDTKMVANLFPSSCVVLKHRQEK